MAQDGTGYWSYGGKTLTHSGHIEFVISQSSIKKFQNACEAITSTMIFANKAAAEEAAWALSSESISEVPLDTGALVSSQYLGLTDTAEPLFGPIATTVVIGYALDGGNSIFSGVNVFAGGGVNTAGGDIKASKGSGNTVTWLIPPHTVKNRRTGLAASAYAARVHEDLSMAHPNGGKAKYLEDPVTRWAAGKFLHVAVRHWTVALQRTTLRGYARAYDSKVGGWGFQRTVTPGYKAIFSSPQSSITHTKFKPGGRTRKVGKVFGAERGNKF